MGYCTFYLQRPKAEGEKSKMSKYEPLWIYIQNQNQETCTLSFQQIETILGFPIDHSFLNCKKELTKYGFSIQKISLKEKNIYVKKDM